jgi:hypothetical protein
MSACEMWVYTDLEPLREQFEVNANDDDKRRSQDGALPDPGLG